MKKKKEGNIIESFSGVVSQAAMLEEAFLIDEAEKGIHETFDDKSSFESDMQSIVEEQGAISNATPKPKKMSKANREAFFKLAKKRAEEQDRDKRSGV